MVLFEGKSSSKSEALQDLASGTITFGTCLYRLVLYFDESTLEGKTTLGNNGLFSMPIWRLLGGLEPKA